MLDAYVRRQLERKAFPGLTLLAGAGGRVLCERRFGLRATWPDPEPLDAGTLYDLASLTKPLVTAFLAAWFVERGEWRLQDEARRFLPQLKPLPATLGQLLTHSAGLRPWHPFYLYRPQDDLEQAAALPLEEAPGTRVIYSDVGYILLRHLLPNVMHLVLITVVIDFSGLVLAEAVLSYVGVGVDPAMISFGNMINGARLELAREPVVWWQLAAAFLFMFVLVLAANLFADQVRDALDPKSKGHR